jgi:hypothetical protein
MDASGGIDAFHMFRARASTHPTMLSVFSLAAVLSPIVRRGRSCVA